MRAAILMQAQIPIFQLRHNIFILIRQIINILIFITAIHIIMWKITNAILLSIILFILAFPNNNKANDRLGLKKVADLKLARPTVVQTNIPPALKQNKKLNLLKSAALATMLATGIMAGYNSPNNLMERNDDTSGHIISKNSTNNVGLIEKAREYYENLKNANNVSSKVNGAFANLYGKEKWASQMDKENMTKFGVGWLEHAENKIKNIGLNSAENLTNFMKETWLNRCSKQIDIEIGVNMGTDMKENVIKIVEIMKKILEIDVNVKIDSMMNENEKNDGIEIQFKLHNSQTGDVENRQIGNSLLFDKQGKMEINSVELGKLLIRNICGGNDCDQPENLPQFGANPCSAKPPPELHELDRALRPMLLKLGSKLNTGRLWTDNPMPDYKNGFYVAFICEVRSNLWANDSDWQSLLKAQLERFERNAPIRFVGLQNGNIESSKFKNRLHFVIHNGKSLAKNGLQRNEGKNVVYLNAEELKKSTYSYAIQEILLKALGACAGEGLRTEYDRRDKHMPKLRRAFAQLNAAYGAENYSIQGQPFLFYDKNNNRIIDMPEVEFWMGEEYANFATRKYEIPVVYDESFKEIAKQNQKLFDEIYVGFAKNSVIQFVVHDEVPKNKNYIRIYRSKDDDMAMAFVGRVTERGPSYQGEVVEFGKNRINKRTLYHELMHSAGMQHEHQRADVEKYLGVDRQKAKKKWSFNDAQYVVNFMTNPIYLPPNEYNPASIMHYDMNYEFFLPKSEIAKQQKDQELPIEPSQMDWENLNHFYGVGKGRTQFKVEIDENGQQKIVEDIDGMRRLKK